MRVGFVGLGRMGAPMVRNLAEAGYDLVLWNRSSDKAVTLGNEIGAEVSMTPRDLANACDLVITMLADDVGSDAVHSGPDGLFLGERAKTFIEMGTMSPDHIQALAAAAPQGTTIIDAPVSGATQAAKDAQLLIMAGCSAETGAALMPSFDTLGRQTIYLNTLGAGSVMKLAVNSLIHGINQTMAEAMTLAEAAGIAPAAAFDVIEASAACAPMLKYRRPIYLDEAAHDVTFTIALARKDMDVAVALAKSLGVDMPQGLETLRQLQGAEADGFADRDMASMLSYMRKDRT
jgi:3-hydroxyisobutyrate dehydrogenase-like beta-hydroxyacid dehydrogenase